MKVALFGAKGQMGEALSALLVETYEEMEILKLDKEQGKDPKALEKMDMVLDFSTKEALPEVLAYCLHHQVPLVMGTTGHEEEAQKSLVEASKKIPVFQSGNYSLGIYVLRQVLKRAAALLMEDADVEIIERHHKKKKDAPSGTALMLLEALEEVLPGREATFGRSGFALRGEKEVGIHAVRGGSIVGEHEVVFALDSEVLSFKHQGESRRLFAKGALLAMDYLLEKGPGYYTMDELMRGRF